jgi:Protein of unknown function (DUF3833)
MQFQDRIARSHRIADARARERSWLAIALAALLLGCNSMKLEDFAGRDPKLQLEQYFVGKTEAWGIFEDRFGNLRRQFKVDIDGTFDGGTLELVEQFAFADGETDTRIWRIRPLPDGRYEGAADDVVGLAHGAAQGNALNWQYDVMLEIGGRSWQVHFDDWMFLQDDRTVINRATVSKFGLTLGEVIIFFRKPQPCVRAAALDVNPNLAAREVAAHKEGVWTAASSWGVTGAAYERFSEHLLTPSITAYSVWHRGRERRFSTLRLALAGPPVSWLPGKRRLPGSTIARSS